MAFSGRRLYDDGAVASTVSVEPQVEIEELIVHGARLMPGTEYYGRPYLK
jgi:hypothetical protein